MKTIAIMNQKGGVGKTTLTRNIGEYFANNGFKTLLVDLDHQANLTRSLNVLHIADDDDMDQWAIHESWQKVEVGMADMFEANIFVPHNIRLNLDLLPNDISFAAMDIEIMGRFKRESILKDILAIGAENYDFAFIDCPPSLSTISVNAMNACDYLIIPVKPSEFSYAGLRHMLDTVGDIRKQLNPNLKVLGIVFNEFDARRTEAQVAKERICQKFSEVNIFKTEIRISEEYKKAERKHLSVFDYTSRREVKDEIGLLCNEINAAL